MPVLAEGIAQERTAVETDVWEKPADEFRRRETEDLVLDAVIDELHRAGHVENPLSSW
jgi:hypothetical protein